MTTPSTSDMQVQRPPQVGLAACLHVPFWLHVLTTVDLSAGCIYCLGLRRSDYRPVLMRSIASWDRQVSRYVT